MSCCRATIETDDPGRSVSSTIRRFSCFDIRRRRSLIRPPADLITIGLQDDGSQRPYLDGNNQSLTKFLLAGLVRKRDESPEL